VGRHEVILLDTHVIIWLTTDTRSLGPQSRTFYERALADNEAAVSATSFWEIAMLMGKGRLKGSISAREQRRAILESGIQELPMTGAIAIDAAELADLHRHPADRFIVATALAHRATLLTADRQLLAWGEGNLSRQDASQ
jgi:PIN domain nuclease of toxin-antitoxin system